MCFAYIRKTNITFVLTVRPSVRPHPITRLPLDGLLKKNVHCGTFKKLWKKILARLSLTRITETLRRDINTFMTSRWILLFCILYFVKQIKSLFNIHNVLSEDRVVYKIMWKNILQADRYGTHGNIIRSVRFCMLFT
jgi:hypothetical protein